MTITEMPSVEVTAPALAPYPFGLFSVAPADLPAEAGWTAGVWWSTAACQQVGVTFLPCNVDDPVPAKDVNVVCGIATAGTFTVYARSDQSTGGAPLAERFAQARDLLLAGEQYAVEQALWALLVAATPDPAEDTAATPVEAVAAAEALMPSRYGGTPVMHMNRRLATRAGAASALRVNGTRLTTFLGAPVVAGGGYPDDDEAVIATGGIVLLRGEAFDLGQTIDSATNSISAVVERTYAVGWDCTAVRVAIA